MPKRISTDFNNADLLRQLKDSGVSFVLVGGGLSRLTAAAMNYLPELDILIDPTIENAQRVISVLSANGVPLRIRATDLAGPKKAAGG